MDCGSDHQRSEEVHVEGEEVEGTSQRRRGPSVPKWRKQLCSFDMSGKCVSDNASAFSKYVASEVRDPRNFPLAKHWRTIKDEDKEAFWERIKGNICFEDAEIPKMPLISYMTLKVAGHAHKEFRNKLKKKYYTGRAAGERCQPPPDVNPTQWGNLLAYWTRDKTKEVAEKNKINRKKKTMNHTTGTKSYARKRQEYRKKHGKEADPVTFFRECHTRKNETWIDETSEHIGATMETNLQTLIQSGQEDSEDLRTRVYVDTMGPEKYNRVRGYGHGVTPDMVSYASSSSSTSISSKRSSNSAMALLMTQNNELKMTNENNHKRISDLENKQSQMIAWLFQRFQPHPQAPYSPGSQQSGQSQPPPPPQQSGQSQPPPHPQQSGQSQPPPAHPYAGHTQQPPYPMPYMQPPTYMQQPPMPCMQQPSMPYMQEPPYQLPVYRPEMAAPSGFCPEFPAGGFSEMLAGVGFDVDLTRMLASDRGSQGREGSVPRSGADSAT